MLADATKNDPTLSPEAFSLYYFPEIPAGGEKYSSSDRERPTFISGTANGSTQRPDPKRGTHESSQAQSAVDEAFSRGVEKGRAEMKATYQETVDRTVSALNHAIEELIRVHRHDQASKEKETVRLALAIARRIIGGERGNETVIQHVVHEAMQKVSDPRQLTIRLNPEDIEVVSQMRDRLLPDEASDAAIHLQPDDSIGRGGCIIETRLGDVDARIEQQIGIVEALLSAELTAGGSDG